MKTTEITVQYERKLSDGNYGSEGLSFSITTSIDHAELGDGVLKAWAQALRVEVLTELTKSAAPRVAAAASYELNPPNLTPRSTATEDAALQDIPF